MYSGTAIYNFTVIDDAMHTCLRACALVRVNHIFRFHHSPVHDNLIQREQRQETWDSSLCPHSTSYHICTSGAAGSAKRPSRMQYSSGYRARMAEWDLPVWRQEGVGVAAPRRPDDEGAVQRVAEEGGVRVPVCHHSDSVPSCPGR